MKTPLVSVIMATHNDEKFLRQAIESVLSQTYQNSELIVINDASTDSTAEILADFLSLNKQIIVLTNKQKLGLTNSLNIGIEKAKGEYIARIDSDDFWNDNEKIKKQVRFLNTNRKYGVVGCWSKTIDSSGKVISLLQYPVQDSEIRKYFLIENCFIHSSVLIRSSVIKKESAYNKKYHFAQDYDLWLSTGLKTKMHNLPAFMVYYRKNPSGMSQQNYKKQIAETITIIKSYENKYPYAALSLLLWRIRLYIPLSIRETVSYLLRKRLFYRTLSSTS